MMYNFKYKELALYSLSLPRLAMQNKASQPLDDGLPLGLDNSLFAGACPVCCTMFSSLPSFCLLDASRNPHL